MAEGWDESAQAWIEVLGEYGDWGRRYVLDRPMLARLEGFGFRRAVDIGCGEGRFCRRMKALGIDTVGIDPTRPLIERARERDPGGDYRVGRAESLDLPDGSCDLAVSYLSLVDMQTLLRAGFVLRHFAEPSPIGVDDEKADRYRRAPYFLLMEWQKPAAD